MISRGARRVAWLIPYTGEHGENYKTFFNYFEICFVVYIPVVVIDLCLKHMTFFYRPGKNLDSEVYGGAEDLEALR
jgi:hypothetical protein